MTPNGTPLRLGATFIWKIFERHRRCASLRSIDSASAAPSLLTGLPPQLNFASQLAYIASTKVDELVSPFTAVTCSCISSIEWSNHWLMNQCPPSNYASVCGLWQHSLSTICSCLLSFFLSFFSIEIEPYVPEVLATHARPRVPPEKSR